MAQKVTSTDIKLALKEFHNGKPSYFITECKTCSTYFPDPQGLLKFDGLAITKSYTKPNIIGYEIKVSRNDFLQDNKWHLYLMILLKEAWSRARDEGVGVMEDFIGKPFTATTMSELNYLVNAPLESINRELREELGIELYVNTLPQIEDNSVSGILRVKRVGEPVRFI